MKSISKIQSTFRAFEKRNVLGAVVGEVGVPDENGRRKREAHLMHRGIRIRGRVDVPFLMDLPLARHFPAVDYDADARRYGTIAARRHTKPHGT